LWRTRLIDARRTAGKNDAAWLQRQHILSRRIVGHKFAVDAKFAQPTNDQLRRLRPEIENRNRFVHDEKQEQS
jgi:hypothetical protein